MNADTYNSLQALQFFQLGLEPQSLKFHTFHRPTEGMKFQGFAALSPTRKTALILESIQSIGKQQLASERLESMP